MMIMMAMGDARFLSMQQGIGSQKPSSVPKEWGALDEIPSPTTKSM